MKRFLITLAAVLFVSAGSFGLALAPRVLADTAQNDICSGALGDSSSGSCASPTGTPTVNGTLTNVINILTTIIGAVVVIMVIYGGMQIVFSGGDPGKVKSGREAIVYALIGAVVVIMAQVLVHFVLQKVQ